MKRVISILLVLALALGLCACGRRKKKNEPVVHTVRIGVLEPLSGSNSLLGRKELLGVRFAHSVTSSLTLNREIYQIELVEADCGSSAEEAEAAAQTLVDSGVAAVLGLNDSALALAAGPVFERAGVAVVGAGCSDEGLSTLGNYFFRLSHTDAQEAKALAAFAREKYEGTTAYVLSLDDEEGWALANRFRSAFEALGGAVFHDTVRAGTSDFAPYLERAASAGAVVIYLALGASYAVRVVNQAAAVEEFATPILGTHRMDDPRVPDAADPESALRIYTAAYCRLNGEGSFAASVQAYLDAEPEALQLNGGSRQISTVTALGCDAYDVVLEAIRSAGSADKADILARLPAVVWRGVSGELRFDESGAAQREQIHLRKANLKTAVWQVDAALPIEK